MAELIDVLSPILTDCISFTVDTTGPDYVQVVNPGFVDLVNNSDKKIFSKGDNCIIMSIGFVLPESFTLFKLDADLISLMRFDLIPFGITSGTPYVNQNIIDGVQLPLENYELGVGTFFECEASQGALPADSLLKENFKFKCQIGKLFTPKISMKNVPATYNGEVFRIVPFIKIMHNSRLS